LRKADDPDAIARLGEAHHVQNIAKAAKSAVMTPYKRRDPISQWVAKLKDRVGWQKACVAIGHKRARIEWAMLVTGKSSVTAHISAFPGAPAMTH
jgi:hypothetical protein